MKISINLTTFSLLLLSSSTAASELGNNDRKLLLGSPQATAERALLSIDPTGWCPYSEYNMDTGLFKGNCTYEFDSTQTVTCGGGDNGPYACTYNSLCWAEAAGFPAEMCEQVCPLATDSDIKCAGEAWTPYLCGSDFCEYPR